MQRALTERCRLERIAFDQEFLAIETAGIRHPRIEESRARTVLSKVPSIFAIAEKLEDSYRRPLWASNQYGSR